MALAQAPKKSSLVSKKPSNSPPVPAFATLSRTRAILLSDETKEYSHNKFDTARIFAVKVGKKPLLVVFVNTDFL